MHRDFKELLSAFNEGHVKYLVVGGYAVSMHAEPRATKDLDILVGADSENSKAVYAALAKFGVVTEDFLVRHSGREPAEDIRHRNMHMANTGVRAPRVAVEFEGTGLGSAYDFAEAAARLTPPPAARSVSAATAPPRHSWSFTGTRNSHRYPQ